MLCGREKWSMSMVAQEFNRRHPVRAAPLSQRSVSRLLAKFKETGSVLDKKSPGDTLDQEEEEMILANANAFPKKSLRKHALDVGRGKDSVRKVLKKHHFWPFKVNVLHHLAEADPDKRTEMCLWLIFQIEDDPTFLTKVLFSDEANFYTNGMFNRHNHQHWADENPQWISATSGQGAQRIMVWLGVFNDRFFFLF